MKHFHPKEAGQAIITAIILFVFVSMGIVVGMTAPVVRDISIAHDVANSKKTYFLAEAAFEDALYRLGHGMAIDSTETLTIGEDSASVSITDILGGKVITSVGDVDGATRKLSGTIYAGTGVAFNYGVQTGHGGFYMGQNAGVNGNVYSNGNLIGENGSFVTGTAIAANSAALTSDQSNTLPSSPPQSIIFGNANGTQDIAQSFQLSTTSPINKIDLYIKKTSTPGNATVRIVNDSSGNPGGTTLTSGTLSSANVTTAYGWVSVTLSPNPELTLGTTYWLVVDAGTDASR